MNFSAQYLWTDAPTETLQILQWLSDAENSTSETEWRTESAEDYRFYGGDQDTDEVLAILESQNRPASVYNEVKPKIDMLVGLAAQGKHDTTLVPVGSEDEAFSEVMSGVLKHYRNKLKLGRKELDCFEHTVKSGRSLLYFWVDVSNPFKPEIKCRRVRGYNYFRDPNCQEYDYSDGRYLFIEKWLPAEDIRREWPGFDVTQLEVFGARYSDMPTFFNEARDLYRIMECWYYKHEDVIYFVNPMTGVVEDLPEGKFNEFLQVLEQQGQDTSKVVSAKGIKKVPYYRIFSGMVTLYEGRSQFKWEGFPAIEFGAYRNEDTNAWFGAVTMMKDPQVAVNTMRRQLQHLLQTLPKGILAHEVGAILNIEEYEEHSSEPNFHMEIMAGKMDAFKFVQQPAISPIYNQFDQTAQQAIKDASGIQDSLMGIQQTGREAGVTERMRQETGIAVLYLLFSNFQESRHNGTRLLMSLIQQYVTMPEVVRIEGEQGAKLMEINTQLNRQLAGFNDITAMQFDLAVEDTAETTTMRMTIAQILAEVNHNNPGSIPPDVILEYSDVPYTIKQRVRDNFESQQKAASQQAEIEARKIEADVQAKQAEVQIKFAELDIKKAELALKEKELELKRMDILLKNRDKPEAPPAVGGAAKQSKSKPKRS